MRSKKKHLITVTMALICAFICSPATYAETERKTDPIEIADAEVVVSETPAAAVLTEVAKPVEETEEITTPQPVEEAEEIPPTLLVDHLASETYEGLEDPNAKIVLIDISDQYVWAFENGVAVLESPMVSGTAGTKSETSRGVFAITKKVPGKYLNGPKGADGKPRWRSWVDYWMPFDTKRSIGLHDASWRDASEYVPETYLSDGSHGCVNLPNEFAPLLYDFVEVGTPVIVQD